MTLRVSRDMMKASIDVVANQYGVCSEYVAEGLIEEIFRAMARAGGSDAAYFVSTAIHILRMEDAAKSSAL